MGGPDTSPRQHGHTSMLDLRLNDELLVGEHVREGIDILADDGKLERIPDSLLNLRSLKSSAGDGLLGRCEGGRGSEESGGDSELHGFRLVQYGSYWCSSSGGGIGLQRGRCNLHRSRATCKPRRTQDIFNLAILVERSYVRHMRI